MGYVLPGWLDEILDFIGINWPNVDEDDYREMADAMRELADAFDDHAGEAHGAVSRLLSSSEGWAVDAMQEHWDRVKSSHLEQLPEVARLFADALDVIADVIYGMKIKAEIELGAMAATAGVSIGLAVVTGGLSALLGAAQITAMREAVRRIIKEAAEQIVDQIIAMVTEPVAAKLEDMVADAVLELATDAFSPGSGDGGGNGGGDGKGASGMNLNSASGPGGGGGSGPGGGKGMRLDHVEYEKAAGDLGRISENSLTRLNGSLDRAHGANSRTKGKDTFTQGFDSIVDGGVKGMKKAVRAIIRHNGELVPKNMRDTSNNHKRNEKANEDALRKILGDRDGKSGPGSPSKGPETPGGKHSPGNGRAADRPTDPELSRKGREAGDGCFGGDPIDMESGEVFLTQTDVKLPGALPLIVKRTHRSSYRHGRFFGPSWSSTLDERLESVPGKRGELWWHRPDGSSLRYDHAPDLIGEQVQPREGRRLPLTCLQGADGWDLAIHDPRSGLSRRFLPASGSGEATAAWWLVEVEDRNGNTLIIERDADGTPTSVSHSRADYRLAVHTQEGRITALGLHTPDGEQAVVSYGHDTDGNLAEVINSSGRPLRFGYDADHRMTSWTDRNESTYTYTYDPVGRVERTTGPDGYLSSSLAYDPERRRTRYTDATGAVTAYEFNELGQAVAETDPLGNTTRTEWDRHDRVLSRTDALGRTTAFEYDDSGNATAVVHPDGSRTEISYSRLHLPTAISLPGGGVERREYDHYGNRTLLTDVTGSTTHYTYDDRGHLASVTNALGDTATVRCDAAGLPVEIVDPQGAASRYERDAFGRPVRLISPEGAITVLEWTVEGKLARRTWPDSRSESWTYDGEGNCTSHTDAMGAVSTSEYTHFDLLVARTGPDGATHSFEHDAELRLTRVINPLGSTWDYSYDEAGRLTAESDFDGRTLTYTHDAAGQLSSRTTADGQTITFERDVLGRVRAKHASATTTYTYDALGALSQASGPDAVLTLERDVAGRLISETVNGRTSRYSYDALGRRTRRTTPSGAVSTSTYDASGNRTHLNVSGHDLSFAYDMAGRELARHIGESLVLHNTFDTRDRLTEQTVVSGADQRLLQQRAYTYRADGHVNAINDRLNGARQFALDPAGRVTAVRAANWTETYAYDATGNQTAAAWPDFMPGYDATGPRIYTGTRIRSAGSVRYEHDEAGRVVLRQKTRLSRKPDTWRYTWDAEDRLTSVVTPDGITWRYLYDPLGRRIAKQRLSSDGETVAEQVDFTWDGSTLCEQATRIDRSPEVVTLTWDHDGHRPLTQTERKAVIADTEIGQQEVDSRFFAIVSDLVGTPSELVDEQGNIAWRARTTLWGETAWARGASAFTPLRFPGQYHDPESGLHYNFHRFYDPENAQYVTPDPLGLTPGPNPTAYVHNPLTWTDLLGLAPDEECPKSVPIYRTPKAADADYERDFGPNPDNHVAGVDMGGGYLTDGKIYFGERGVAAEYWSPNPDSKNFANGMVRYDMHPDFLEEFGEHAAVHDRHGPNGAPRIEFAIPSDKLDRFNELTLNRSWIPHPGR